MDVVDIVSRVRAAFDTPPRAPISDAIALITASVRDQHRESSDAGSISDSLVNLEKDLLEIYENLVNHIYVPHLEAFLSVLFALQPVLPASSLISWFNHLRPALREPQLSPETKKSLQALVSSALDESTHAAESRSRDFRRQLLHLYIQDSSGTVASADEIVEDLNRTLAEQRTSAAWKENLEAILETDLMTSPDECLAVLNVEFLEPTARYPIVALLLRVFASKSALPPIVSLAKSAWIDSFFTSLLVDKSTALFEREMITLLIILPYMAVYAPTRLRRLLPKLLASLSRAICWKKRPQKDEYAREARSSSDIGLSLVSARRVCNSFAIRLMMASEREENDTITIDPSPLFTFIYGLFPCNTIAFLRRPVARLEELGFTSPLGVRWAFILDESEIRAKSTVLVRSHSFHPDVLFRDAPSELLNPHSWGSSTSVANPSTDDVARLTATCIRLDFSGQGALNPEELVRGSDADADTDALVSTPHSMESASRSSSSASPLPYPPQSSASASSDPSASDLLAATKSGSFNAPGSSLSPSPDPNTLMTASTPDSDTRRALETLQRENMRLKDLNLLALWMREQMKKHVERLHRDRIVLTGEEMERQNLHNRLREYKRRLAAAEEEIKRLKREGDIKSKRSREWVDELQKKLAEFRSEKRSWTDEAVALRGQVADAQV
ncbi:hypothetical protein DL93DRAFT_2055741 [Clavulina sp. PMI_390]|nr:hypothetical protein DL93DRAFT_2055741 [Clavulina sp. PMI_390]